MRTSPRGRCAPQEEPLGLHGLLSAASSSGIKRWRDDLLDHRANLHWSGRYDRLYLQRNDLGGLAGNSNLAWRMADRSWCSVHLRHSAEQPENYAPVSSSPKSKARPGGLFVGAACCLGLVAPTLWHSRSRLWLRPRKQLDERNVSINFPTLISCDGGSARSKSVLT